MKKKKYTISDIARMADVSKTTVSFFLNGKTDKMSDETKNRIDSIIKETGYIPNYAARCLNDKGSRLIAVIIGDISNSFSAQIVKGIEKEARKMNYQILIGNSNYDSIEEEKYIDKMLMLNVDGFIVQPGSHFNRLGKKIVNSGKPLVFFDSKIYEEDKCWVKTNNYEASYEAIYECIKKGYENFLIIAAEPNLLSTRIERASGFIDAVNENNKEYSFLEISEKPDTSIIKQKVSEELKKNKSLLIFVPNCWALPDVFHSISDFHDQIPENLGIIGFDNENWINYVTPKITSIVQPAYSEGQKACRILIDRIEDKNLEKPHQILKSKIFWNNSTK